VAKLFESLEDGTVPQPAEEVEASKAIKTGSAITSGTEVVEVKTSPPRLERLPSTGLRAFGEGEDESSDDGDDDDRNHKHRRRVSRSRSFDRDGEDEVDRGLYRKRGRAVDNGQILRENERPGNERRGPGYNVHNDRDGPGKFDRRLGRDHGPGRFNADGGQRGMGRLGPQFRDGPGPRFDGANGMMRGNIGRGRGIGHAWGGPHDQRFPPPSFPDGPDFAPPLVPPGPGTGFFPGRGIPGRGTPHAGWAGFGPLPGLGNGPLEHPHPLGGGIGGGRGPPPLSAGMGMGMNINMGRPRCLDFEERGYCLRGDLCPMEHGANRIVVEDVQVCRFFL
jgi:RNA-binding protein 26